MGLKITTPLHTNKGETSEMYINIETMMLLKNGKNNIRINKYLNKAVRDVNVNDKCECYEINDTYQINVSPLQLAGSNVYTIIYGKITELLGAKNITAILE